MDRREKRRRKAKIRKTIASLVLVALLLFAGIKLIPKLFNGSGSGTDVPPVDQPPAEPKKETISIYCLGDIMTHQGQLDAAYNKESDSYSFDSVFEYVAPITSEADLTIANIETTFKGKAPYAGYPTFNTPDALANTIVRRLGVDLACFANNHMIDNGVSVLKRGVGVFRDLGVATAGARLDSSENRYNIVDVKGVKVGIINYTYETPRNNGQRTVQAIVLSDEAKATINHFGYEDFEGDMAMIKEQMDAARADGADIIVCYMHWGEEYQRNANKWERKIAESLANNGADIIFGSHPHVLQEIEGIQANGKTVPVFYSLGNFVSNQRQESIQDRYTEQGMIAEVKLTYNLDEKKIEDIDFGCTPTWVDRYSGTSSKYQYTVVPLCGSFEENSVLKASGHVDRAKQALSDVKSLIGESRVNNIR